MDFRKARETDDIPPATPDDSGLIPIDFAHLVDALQRAQRQSVAAVAEDAAASRLRSIISDNALKGLEAMTPRAAELPPLHGPGTFHDRVAEIVRASTPERAADAIERVKSGSEEINAAVTESSSE